MKQFKGDINYSDIVMAFGVLLFFQYIGGYYFAFFLRNSFEICSKLPWEFLYFSIGMISLLLFPLAYLSAKSGFLSYKNYSINEWKQVEIIIAGIILCFMVNYLGLVLSAKKIDAHIYNTITLPKPYSYYIFILVIFIVPILEETLYRGYIFEGTRKKLGDYVAAIVTSILFLIGHATFAINSIYDAVLNIIPALFIFISSLLFTFVYIWGRIAASIIVHAFANLYLLYLIR